MLCCHVVAELILKSQSQFLGPLCLWQCLLVESVRLFVTYTFKSFGVLPTWVHLWWYFFPLFIKLKFVISGAWILWSFMSTTSSLWIVKWHLTRLLRRRSTPLGHLSNLSNLAEWSEWLKLEKLLTSHSPDDNWIRVEVPPWRLFEHQGSLLQPLRRPGISTQPCGGHLFLLKIVFFSLLQEHLVTDAYVEQLLQINPMPALVAFYFEKCVLTEEVAWFCFINGHTQKIEHILQNMDFCWKSEIF